MRRAREQGLSLTGPDGLLKQPTKTALETALNQEMTEHLGHEKHGRPVTGSGNVRNGRGYARSGESGTDRKRLVGACGTSGRGTQRSRAAASTTSTLSHPVSPRLPRLAAGPHGTLLLLHGLLQRQNAKALSLPGKGLDLRKLVAGAGFEPATSGL